MSRLFKAEMPQLILEQRKLVPAAILYALYSIGIAAFGVLPAIAAQDWVRAAAMSALFGLLAYVTYELTNLATLKGWSAPIASAFPTRRTQRLSVTNSSLARNASEPR